MKIIITILMFALILRLCYITLVQGGMLKNEAFLQQTSVTSANEGRNYIYDRNFRVIAGGSPRYKDNSILSHVIGYTWDGGASGIEKAFNDSLISTKPNAVAEVKDANGNKVNELYLKGETDYSGIKLTVDYNIQKAVEEVMEDEELTGCAIVVNCKDGGILAMASKPDFNRKNITSYFDSKNGELLNRAISQYNVGSVFKIITAAAALETQFSYEYVFECNGKTNINGRDFVCNKEEGHGVITFPQGFAHSCNCLFYHLGITTGYEQIRKYAYDFGLGEKVLKINGFDENRGNIPVNVGITDSDVANISIGQGEILATPLQIADVMCTIANDGVRKQITLISGLVDENGVCADIKATETGRIISVDTARILKQMLKEAVEYGTGTPAELDDVSVSGKTATAESGWEKDGKTMTHGWFAGYFPSDNPQYVCVVLAEDGSYGSVSAAPVFKKIGEKILDLY